MKANKRVLSFALAALTLVGQLTLPAAAADGPAWEGDLVIEEVFRDQRLQSWLQNGSNLDGAGADGVLTREEREAVTALDLSGLGLTSLDHLAAFPNLKSLNCSQNQLTALDLSGNPALEQLSCGNNRLTELDMSRNQKLEGGGFVARNNVMEKIFLPNQPGLTVYLDDYDEQNPVDGYDRVAWYLDEAGTQAAPEELEAAGQTLYSRRIPNRYTVYFAPNGGRGTMASVSGQWDSAFFLPENTFTRTGYTFSGWSATFNSQSMDYTDQAPVENLAGKKTDGDRITLYAQWQGNPYTIRLEPNGGEGSGQEISTRYGASVTLSNPFSHADEDLEFAGWGTAPEGPVRYPNGATVQNLTAEAGETVTLYALWRTSLAGEQKIYLARLEETFRSLGSADGETLRYTQEDWAALSAAYAQGVAAVEAAQDTGAMADAAAAAEAAMEAVPTAEERVAEVVGGWQAAHRQALQLLAAKNLTEAGAADAAALARTALSELQQDVLAGYSGLTGVQDKEQVVGQAALQLQETADQLMTFAQAAAWLETLEGLTLRPMAEIRGADLDACQTALSHYEALDVAQKAYLSDAVAASLTQRYQLAGQKRSDAADLQSAYDSLDLSVYSAKGRAALAEALSQGLDAIDAASDPEASQAARRTAWAGMEQVPTADQETTDPPAPPAGGGGGGTTVPENPDVPAGETVTVTDDKTGATAQVTTSADGKVTAQVTVPQGAGTSTLAIPCRGGASTVAVVVEEDGSRRVLPYTVYGDGALTVRLEHSARIEVVDNAKTFSDVGEAAWYADAVQFTASRELFNGVGGDAFVPGGTMTRAMLVTVLHRLEGSPAPGADSPFQDVPKDAWYSEAADWAAELGISGGTGGALFSPGSAVTREQLAVMLYRYAGSPSLAKGDGLSFEDGDQISPWVRDAVAWACDRGILTGDTSGLLRPGDNSTRAEVSAMLFRFVRQAMA